MIRFDDLKTRVSVPMARLCSAGVLCAIAVLMIFAPAARAQNRQRELNSEYAARRGRLRAQVEAPVVIFGYTGKESASEAYVFNQENNFYYLTGHNEEGAALLLIPDGAEAKGWSGPKEIFYLPTRNLATERWNGPRIGPDDSGVREKVGFAEIRNFTKLAADLQQLAKNYPTFYTLLPHSDDAGYPHAQNWVNWLNKTVPGVKLSQIESQIGALRQIKSAGEIALLTRAIDLSVDAHLDAMRNVRPGLMEYQVAARMVKIHQEGGCETEAYAPIVGAGFNSTVLHYDKIGAKIEDGDVVVLDVGGQYSGYTADITRTLPANGKYTARQREIYDIVYGAQQAALGALKPGARLTRTTGGKDLYQIAYDYINTHGKDLHGQPLGRYFIHGLGHHLGLDVHDAGDPSAVLVPGMVVTVEPGIYIPEEKIGVRIEDDVLITSTGYILLTQRLPRSADEVEKVMAEGKKARAANVNADSAAPASAQN
jgi:Xaa-Pro aminopeptidase